MRSHIYESLVICHPREYCTTWDFCTHYIPHVKGVACSCDSCEPCDLDTVVENRISMILKAKRIFLQWLEESCDSHERPLPKGTVGITDIGWRKYAHRYLCPQCMTEVRKILEIETGEKKCI